MTLAAAAVAMGLLSAGPLDAGRGACDEVVLHRAKQMMATLVAVTARGCAGGKLESRVGESFAEMERLAAILSEWDPESPVSLVNEKAGIAPVHVPAELYSVLEIALRVSARTSGAYDVTWAPLAKLWRFGGAPPPRLPLPDEVKRLRELVGYRHLVLDRAASSAFLERPGMRMGLGGIAKGYIAEAAADFLTAHGVHDVLVAASGDITARGRNGDRPWVVAIRDPRNPSGVRGVVELHDESISTSGDYERFFVIDGRRYHHLLDPRTGYPAKGTASVTVIAPHGATADALATGLFVLGPKRGAAAARGLSGVSVLMIGGDGTLHVVGEAQRFDVSSGASAHSSAAAPPGKGLD